MYFVIICLFIIGTIINLIYVKSIEASLTNVGYFYKKYHIYFNTHLCELRKSIIP